VQIFNVIKPGFLEQMESEREAEVQNYAVRVASGMPELSFSLAQKNAIFGHVTLSTGAPALGIWLTLVRQTIVDGRAGWEEGERRLTTRTARFDSPGCGTAHIY